MSRERTTRGLRDILFDEIEELQTDKANPSKAMAVANLARQIINTARVEMEFIRAIKAEKELGNEVQIGTLPLGSGTKNATGAETSATER